MFPLFIAFVTLFMDDVTSAPSYDIKTRLRMLMEFLKQCKQIHVPSSLSHTSLRQPSFGDPRYTSLRTWRGPTTMTLSFSTSRTGLVSLLPSWEP